MAIRISNLIVFCFREFRRHSCDWFYSHLQKRFHDFGSAKVVKSVGFNSKSWLSRVTRSFDWKRAQTNPKNAQWCFVTKSSVLGLFWFIRALLKKAQIAVNCRIWSRQLLHRVLCGGWRWGRCRNVIKKLRWENREEIENETEREEERDRVNLRLRWRIIKTQRQNIAVWERTSERKRNMENIERPEKKNDWLSSKIMDRFCSIYFDNEKKKLKGNNWI